MDPYRLDPAPKTVPETGRLPRYTAAGTGLPPVNHLRRSRRVGRTAAAADREFPGETTAPRAGMVPTTVTPFSFARLRHDSHLRASGTTSFARLRHDALPHSCRCANPPGLCSNVTPRTVHHEHGHVVVLFVAGQHPLNQVIKEHRRIFHGLGRSLSRHRDQLVKARVQTAPAVLHQS